MDLLGSQASRGVEPDALLVEPGPVGQGGGADLFPGVLRIHVLQKGQESLEARLYDIQNGGLCSLQ